MDIKRFILSRINSNTKKRIRKNILKTKKRLKFWIKPLTLDKLESILRNDLEIKVGDKIFVTSGFGSLNANFAPDELIKLLMRIVGVDGLIVMPFYPPGSSSEWSESGNVFDMKTTKSSTGVVTNVFSKMDGVYKSIHPTKSVVAWGKGAKELVEGHENSTTPFYKDSPYGKLLELGSVSIGLGAEKFPMGHCIEDIVVNDTFQYKLDKAVLNVREKNNNVVQVATYIHDERRGQIPPPTYIKGCKSHKLVKVGYGYCYRLDNNKAFDYYKEEFAKGHPSIWKK